MIFLVAVAFVFGVVAGVVWQATRERAIGVVSVMWLIYAIYEALMVGRVLCSGECNIRVDLVVLVPILLGVTAGAIAKVELKRRKQQKSETA